MFTLALLIAVYSYLILSCGFFGLLYKEVIIAVTVVLVFGIIFFFKKSFTIHNVRNKTVSFVRKFTKLQLIFLILILFQALVNLVGALGPELGFDALWYHLTIPKMYLANHSVYYIPGGLFYYSAMPKLAEMLYVVGLTLGGEVFAKLMHFSFGILTLVALYLFSRKYFSKTLSWLTVLVFYSNLVVGWQSITAYVDLARTFFEIMALWGFLQWWESEDRKWLVESTVMLGIAISTKLLALESLLIFSILLGLYAYRYKKSIKYFLINLFTYWLMVFLIPLPWFVFSFINTGSPIYPFFSILYKVGLNFESINPFIHKSDSISVVYLLIPILPFIFTKLKRGVKIICLYSFLGLIIWYLTPKTDGGRFLLPYLPAFSVLVVSILIVTKNSLFKKIIICFVILASIFSIVYREIANYKYLPVIFGIESKSNFLSKNLNFSFGDFYDTDGYFARKIKQEDMVLLYGFHNLYYVNFPFIDSSYLKKGDVFNYIAVQGNSLPKRFQIWDLIYYNEKTNVKLYSVGNLKWTY